MSASSFAPVLIDLSRLARPRAIEQLDADQLIGDFITRFLEAWTVFRAADPSLPNYTAEGLRTDLAAIVARPFSALRLEDRQRVNDAVLSVLAPYAEKSDLDAIAASVNIERLVLSPASTTAAAVMETDAALLRRYLLAMSRPAAGSSDRYLLEAWTAWPQMGDCRVNGRAIHGRRGDVDIVVSGPAGRDPTPAELALVRTAVLDPSCKPEAVSVSVMAAQRWPYAVSLVIELPRGPDPQLVVAEAETRVSAAAAERTVIGGEIPPERLAGAAYGANVIKVRDLAPVSRAADPYVTPVCTAIAVAPEVRS